MAGRAQKAAAIIVACALVLSVLVPSVSLAAIPGGYYSVSMFPDVPGSFAGPGDSAVSSAGEVYIADTSNCRIKRMSAAGALLSVWGSRGTGTGQFSDPRGVTVLPSGRVLVADTGNNRLQLFEANGTYVATWGSAGVGNLQFSAPAGLGVDTAGNAYVADAGNGRIQKISSAGAFVTVIGAPGPGNGQLDNPRDVAVDASGNIYVADSNNRRIEKFNSAGAYVTYWGPVEISGTTYSRYSVPSGISVDASGNLFVIDSSGILVTPNNEAAGKYWIERCGPTGGILSQWGSEGVASGQYKSPAGVSARPGGGAYVSDTGNNRIQVLSATGVVDSIWTGRGTAPGALDSPQGVALDASGQSFVADTNNNRIQVFDASGAFVRAFGSLGSGLGQLNAPTDVALDPVSGRVLVADKGNNRVQSFSATGTAPAVFGSIGSATGQFLAPEGIGVDAAGNIYVADTGNARVQKFSSAGGYQSMIATAGTLIAPADVALDASDNCYVADRTPGRIRVFANSGTLIRTIGSFGSPDGQFIQPTGIAVSGGSIFVADTGNNRIQRLTTTGTFETKFGSLGGGAGELSAPSRLAVDSLGRVLVAERDNHRLQLFSYDAIAPVTTQSGFDNFQTYSAPVTMTLDATDVGSGVSVTKYTLNGGAQITYTGPVPITAEGQSTLRFWSVDRMGNIEATKTRFVTIDRIPPAGTLVVAGGASYVGTTSVQAVSTFADAVEMRFNTDGTWPSMFSVFESDVTLTLTGEGEQVVRAEYRDIAGNTSSRQDTVTVDLTAPSSWATITPPGWSNLPVSVSLAASDSASGVDRIVYRLGASGADATYAGAFSVDTEGVTDVYFHAIDEVGNVETTRTASIYVDYTPPAGTLTIAGGLSLVSTDTVSLASDVPDALAMRIDPGDGFGGWVAYDALVDVTVPGEGTIPLQVEYRDRAGNTLLLGGSLDVDLAPPVTVASGIPGGEASEPVTVTLSATDSVSGVDQTFYQLDSGSVETYLSPFEVSKEGTTVVTFWSVDLAGRTESSQTAEVRIDTTAPIGTFTLDNGAAHALTETVWANSAFTDALEMSFDVGAGYGPWIAYDDTASLTLAGEGTHTVEAGYSDSVGNVRILEDSIFVDLAAPETTVTLEATGWSPEPVTVTLTAADTGSGVFATLYRIGGEVTTYTTSFEITAEGETTIEYWSVDRAGRIEDARDVVVRVDTIAPSGTMRIARGARYTLQRTIALDSVVAGATQMQVDTGAGFGPWVAYAASTSVILRTEGANTVTVRYRDPADNRLTLLRSVILDTIAPSFTGVTITVDSHRRPKRPTGTVRATWAATDAAPVVGYSYAIDVVKATVPDTSIDTTTTTLRTTVPTHGTWYFHIRAKDAAGNWSAVRTVPFEVTSRRTVGRVFR